MEARSYCGTGKTAASSVDTWYNKANDHGASHYFHITKPAPKLPPYGDRGGLVAHVVKDSPELKTLAYMTH